MTAAPSMAEVLARWAYEAYDSHFNRHRLSWEDYKAADPGEAEHLYLSIAREQAQALADAGYGHVASVEAERDGLRRAYDTAVDQVESEMDARIAAEAQVAAVRAVLAEHWDWKAGRVLHAAVLNALDGEATP